MPSNDIGMIELNRNVQIIFADVAQSAFGRPIRCLLSMTVCLKGHVRDGPQDLQSTTASAE
jgi:hypothetical protein